MLVDIDGYIQDDKMLVVMVLLAQHEPLPGLLPPGLGLLRAQPCRPSHHRQQAQLPRGRPGDDGGVQKITLLVKRDKD